MASKKMFLLIAAGVGALLLLPVLAFSQGGDLFSTAAAFIASNESFSPVAYWDVSRWSIGYGTAAAGEDSTITEAGARAAMMDFINSDYDYLSAMITVPLNANQWAALLDFSYNEGKGNADNLVPLINAQDWDGLFAKMRLYIYANHVPNDVLRARREREINLFQA